HVVVVRALAQPPQQGAALVKVRADEVSRDVDPTKGAPQGDRTVDPRVAAHLLDVPAGDDAPERVARHDDVRLLGTLAHEFAEAPRDPADADSRRMPERRHTRAGLLLE